MSPTHGPISWPKKRDFFLQPRSLLYLYNTCSTYACPWIWVKAVTSSHECMHHRAGILIQTPPKNPAPPVRGITGPLPAPGNPFIIHTPMGLDQIQPFCRGERNGNWEAGAAVPASEQCLNV